MRRCRRLAALFSVVSLVAAACGGSGPGGTATRDGGIAGGSIDMWIMEPGSSELKEFFTRATADFEAAHPGVRVEIQYVPWANAHDQFVTAIGGGQVPDVAEMGSTWTPEFADVGSLVAFTAGDADTPLSGFVPSLVEGATVDGRVYGLPWYAGARALIYRADVFDELGLAVPTTWDELLSVGRAIRDRKGMFAFGVAGNANHFFLPMVWQNGGELATKEGGRWRSGMDSPEAVAAIDFYAGLYARERFAPPGALSWNARDVRSAFEAGDLAMMIGGGWDLRAMLASHPDLADRVGTALLPEGPSGSADTFAGGSHLVVFEGSGHVELARRLVDFLLEPGRVAGFADQIGFLPAALAGLQAAPSTRDALYGTFSRQLASHSRTYPPTPQWGGFEADNLFTNAVQAVMKGDKTAQAALAEVAKAMNAAFR